MRDYSLTMQTDEYVILGKITRFRQDIHLSATIKIVQMFVEVWQSNEDNMP